VPPEQLYTNGMLANEFHRTVSRIVEMQSREYMEKQQRGAADALV
jgi:cell division protein ZapE